MRTRILLTLLAAGIFLTISCQKNIGTVRLKTQLDTISYCIGITIGSNLMNTPMEEINYEALTKGIQDIFTNQELIINPYEANMLFTDYLYKLQNVQYMANLEEGEEYLEKNKARKDVVSLPSGLQYRIIREGTGPRPALTDNVSVHYHGMLIDGTVFDSSVERGEPVTFPVNGVIDGWKEALQLMPVGSKWEVFIPNDLAYGARPPQGTSIEPYMVLIFEIELLSIEEAQN